jgi:NAD(P)H dehydrogenase (quinone)
MSLLVTGASGQLGRMIAGLLLDSVPAVDIVLVTRTPEALSDFAARGVQVRHGDFHDPPSLASAFAGAERMVLISSRQPARLSQHRSAVEAAHVAGLRHVVYTSITDPVEGNPSLSVPDHRETEQMLRNSGLASTMLRMAFYADTEARACALAIASGRFPSNRGEGRHAYVWREDCAAAAAAVLVSGAEHEGEVYDITGPELISAADEARLISELSGRPVSVQLLDDRMYATYVEQAVPQILPPERAVRRASDGEAMRAGYFSQLSTAVQDLTGRRPRSLAEMLAATIGVR